MSVLNTPPNTAVEPLIIHGVLLRIFDLGVLLSGPPGVGKSQTALDLIQRQHALIADDAPLFSQNESGSLIGRCPTVLQDFLEVRGIGVLNIRALFGDQAIVMTQTLDLIIDLIPASLPVQRGLSSPRSWRKIGDGNVANLTLPVTPDRPLATLVEALVRNEQLHRRGYDASRDLSDKQRQQMQRDEL